MKRFISFVEEAKTKATLQMSIGQYRSPCLNFILLQFKKKPLFVCSLVFLSSWKCPQLSGTQAVYGKKRVSIRFARPRTAPEQLILNFSSSMPRDVYIFFWGEAAKKCPKNCNFSFNRNTL
jgi:hypothetical protein